MIHGIPELESILPDGKFPSESFQLFNLTIQHGADTFPESMISGFYNRHGELEFSFERSASLAEAFKSFDGGVILRSSYLKNDATFLLNQTKYSDSGRLKLRFISKTSPFLIGKGKGADYVLAYIVNGPEMILPPINSAFERGNYRISICELNTTEQYRKDPRGHKSDYIVTHEAKIELLTSGTIAPDEAFSVLSQFTKFLTFVRGGYCGFGHVLGYSEGGLAFSYLGFTKSDIFKVEEGWFSIGVSKFLQIAYTNFTDAESNQTDVFPILRGIEFYRAANSTAIQSKEVALVSSYAALETLVPHILITRAGWSKSLLDRSPKFSDQLRAVFAFLDLQGPLFKHSPMLKKRLKGSDSMDEFDILSLFRNRIVHHNRKFKMEGLELFEVLNFAQWLVELLVFFLIGYSETMNDRRKYYGWSGKTVTVPINLRSRRVSSS